MGWRFRTPRGNDLEEQYIRNLPLDAEDVEDVIHADQHGAVVQLRNGSVRVMPLKEFKRLRHGKN